MARHLIGFGLNFMGGLIVARIIGPAAWGVYSITYILQLSMQALLERGAAGFVIRRAALLTPGQMSTLLVVQACVGILAGVACVALIGPARDLFHAPDLAGLLVALSLALPLMSVRGALLGALERALKYRSVAVIETSEIATFNIAAVIGVLLGAGFYALGVALVLRFAVSTLIAFRLAPRPSWSTQRLQLREAASTSLPFAASSFLWWASAAAVPFVLARGAALSDVGVVYMALTLMTYPQSIMAVIGRVALPSYSLDHREHRDLAGQVGTHVARAMRYAGGLMLLFAVSSVLWVPILFGPGWSAMPPIMLAIAPAYSVTAALTPVIAALNARDNAGAVLALTTLFAGIYWLSATALVGSIGAYSLPVAYAFASPAIVLATLIFQLRVGRIDLGSAPFDLFGFALLLLTAVSVVQSTHSVLLVFAIALVMSLLLARLFVREAGLIGVRGALRGDRH